MNRREFKQHFEKSFELEDIRDLCDDLGIQYENLGGEETRQAKIRELIKEVAKNNRVPDLIKLLKEERPEIPWQEAEKQLKSKLPELPDRQPGWAIVIASVILVAVLIFIALRQNNNKGAITTGDQAAKSEVVETETTVPNPTVTQSVEAEVDRATPESTAMPTPAARPTVAIRPVADDEIMVLVAKFESLTDEEREVARFVAENLRRTLEEDIPFSNVRVREYPQVIKGDDQAVAVADEVGAAVIVWGRYDDTTTSAFIQLGSLQPFPQVQFDRDLLAGNVNVRVNLTNARQDSIANYVMNIIITQQVAANEDASRSLAINDAINAAPVDLLGDNVAVRMHRYGVALIDGEYETGKEEIKRARLLDGDNPFVFYYRSVLNIRTGEFDDATSDILTAQTLGLRTGAENWSMPSELLGFIALFQGDVNGAIGHFAEMVDILPEEWRAHYYLGLAQLLAGDYATARASMNQAISLGPDVNWPYVFAVQIALREGRLPEAIQLGNTILQKFPDPTYGTRVLESTLGGASTIGPTISAFGNGFLGQYQSLLNDVDQALAVNNEITELHWLRGFAHCNLGEFSEAEAAYSAGIEIDSSFPLNYLSRGALRYYLGETGGAQADFQILADSEQAAVYAPLVGFVQAGALNCQNFLSFDPTNLVVIPTIVPPTPLAVEAIEESTAATTVESASVFVAPNSNSVELGTIAAAQIVDVDGRSADNVWLYIVTDDGREGFVMLSQLTTEVAVDSLTIRQPKYGVAIYNSTVFAAADSSSNILGYVAQKDLVEILGRSPNGSWYYVRTSEDNLGFVSATRVNWQGDKLLLPLRE